MHAKLVGPLTRFWPNPFAAGFKEYQFITATTLTSLTSLDDFPIDSDLRPEA